MNQNELREKLCVIIAKGLMAKAISDKTGITTDILSRFKNGHICLCDSDALKLESYLDKVVIPLKVITAIICGYYKLLNVCGYQAQGRTAALWKRLLVGKTSLCRTHKTAYAVQLT